MGLLFIQYYLLIDMVCVHRCIKIIACNNWQIRWPCTPLTRAYHTSVDAECHALSNELVLSVAKGLWVIERGGRYCSHCDNELTASPRRPVVSCVLCSRV